MKRNERGGLQRVGTAVERRKIIYVKGEGKLLARKQKRVNTRRLRKVCSGNELMRLWGEICGAKVSKHMSLGERI